VKNLKTLAVTLLLGMAVTSFAVLIARSKSFGFQLTDLQNASVGINSLMRMMMDWKSVAYIGIPAGLLLFVLEVFSNGSNKKINNADMED
jgi:hypothetical protein